MFMKSVYIFGPIHIFGLNYLPIYKNLAKLCSKYFDKVICTYPDFWNSKETPKQFYGRTLKTITKCDLFIGEVSSPSHGVGMELQMAYQYKIPVIALAREKIEISTMVLGLPNLIKIIRYRTTRDLIKKLESEIINISKTESYSKSQ